MRAGNSSGELRGREDADRRQRQSVRGVEGLCRLSSLHQPAPEIPSWDWPGSGSTDVLVWQYTQTTTLVEAYWFAGYTAGGETGEFRLTAGRFGGIFADDSMPTLQDPMAGFGSLGFNEPGSVACPSSASIGACCIGQACSITCEDDCRGQGGNYLGDGTTCDPSEVCAPVPTRNESWGRIKQEYR